MGDDESAGRARRDEHAHHRVHELQERIDELADRRRELDRYIAEARGSGVGQVRLAHDNLERAKLAADEAAEFAAEANEAAAHAHDRAAAVNEEFAKHEGADREKYAQRAVEHRRSAQEDRAAAVAKRAGARRAPDPPPAG
ncbi:hypothetical protein ACQP2F_44780 [Actinoplanes sp. CA-030573]|uniref:hypothetical protein n=1 Tax=Actinoplanes sp. CA-030573 TaxID=3239898 RepID=UPI003D8FC652